MTAYEDLFELPASQLDFDLLQRFIATAEGANALAESSVLELKLKPSDKKIVEAVAALSNTDGGVVLVGVDEKKHGDERIVGISAMQQDGMIAQLHALMQDAMPEVVPIAIPGTVDQRIVVLRVDANAVPHPVVVSGKVLIRIPGHSLPADRDAIIRLVQRDSTASGPGTGMPQSRFSPANIELWGTAVPLLELRTFGSVRLPATVLTHGWFGSDAKDSTSSVLNRSPLPDQLWSASSTPSRKHAWEITDTRSNWFHLESEARPDLVHPSPIRTAVHIEIVGQDLTGLVALALIPQDDQSIEDLKQRPLPIEHLHEALVALLFVQGQVCRSLAQQLDAPEPIDWFPVTTQMLPGKYDHERVLDDVLDLDRWQRDTTNQLPAYMFHRANSPRDDVEAINNLALLWLNLFLLDVGARHFESDIERLILPPYLQSH